MYFLLCIIIRCSGSIYLSIFILRNIEFIFLPVREDRQVYLKLQNQWLMIDLSEPTLHKYRRKVIEIYRELERNPWAPLGIFESKLRKINILNSKIKNVSSDIGKPEGEYSNSTNDNYVQYGFKKENSSQEDTYKEDSLG